MANLSQEKRQRMLEFLQKIRDEHKDDDNVLKALGEIENELTSQKYGLVWEKHDEEVDIKMQTHIPVFTEDKDREICTVPGEKYNFLLEGDNLHSLRLLEKTHKGKIDVIYIDPPYNTGNEDFIYNDRYVDSEDEYKHSLWLSFMEKRLQNSWQLLKEQGVIFISCDENEYANLKILCDTLFGEQNYIATYFWKKTETPPSLSNKVRRKYEYIVCYGNNVDSQHKFSQGLIDGGDAPLLNSGNPYKKVIFPAGSVRFNVEDGVYKHSDDKKIHILDNVIVEGGTNSNELKAEGTWKWNQDTINEEIKKGTYFIVKSNKFSIRYQRAEIDSVKIPQNNLNSDIGVGTNEEGAKELERIFGIKGIFDYAKPVSLIKFLIKMTNKHNDITILDFFAGSGTTGQAVMELNTEDDGTRKFILCTDNTKNIDAVGDYLHSKGIVAEHPSKSLQKEYKKWKNEINEYFINHHKEFENTKEYNLYGIAQRITYPRLKTYITGLRLDNSPYSEGVLTNLKYYHTDFVSKDEEDLSQALLNHIAEMIQIEHGIKLDGKQYIMILDDDEADQLASHWSEYTDVKALYVSKNVLFTAEQNNLFKNIDIHIIPDYYFNFELREAGESW